jgi:hypothetical protein
MRLRHNVNGALEDLLALVRAINPLQWDAAGSANTIRCSQQCTREVGSAAVTPASLCVFPTQQRNTSTEGLWGSAEPTKQGSCVPECSGGHRRRNRMTSAPSTQHPETCLENVPNTSKNRQQTGERCPLNTPTASRDHEKSQQQGSA